MPRIGNETPICNGCLNINYKNHVIKCKILGNRDDYDCYTDMIRAIELTQNDTYLCNCFPGCFELSYTGDVSIARLGTDQFYTKSNFAKKFGATFSEYDL